MAEEFCPNCLRLARELLQFIGAEQAQAINDVRAMVNRTPDIEYREGALTILDGWASVNDRITSAAVSKLG